MLRKLMLWGLPLFVLLGTVTTVAAFEQRRSPDWRQALDRHLYLTRPSKVEMVVRESVKATMPWNFSAEMGSAHLDPQQWTWGVERLPFPPDAAHCVLVERVLATTAEPAAAMTQQVLYVAHHTDAVWRAGWVVYQALEGPTAATTKDDLAALGCTFAAQERE